MIREQSECSCDYYNVYNLQFFKSLGQLTAGLLSTAVIVPMYTYYTRNFLSNNNQVYTKYENQDDEENEENEEDDEEESSEDEEDSSECEDLRVETDTNSKVEETLKELGYTKLNVLNH